MMFISQAVDAIPENVMPKFLHFAKEIAPFWHDMFLLCATFGLRNIECREMKMSQIDFSAKTIILSDTKSERAQLTRKVNQELESQWLLKGRAWLRQRMLDHNSSLIVRLASSTQELALIAEEYQLDNAYHRARLKFYEQKREVLRVRLSKKNGFSRRLDFSSFHEIEAMLRRRSGQYQNRIYLFPRDELQPYLKQQRKSNKGGDFPLSRQSVYNVVQKIRSQLAERLKGIRLGLHSCRKFAVQRVATLIDDTFAASIWIGHGNGKGDLTMTERYLNRSERRYDEINLKSSKACCFGYYGNSS
ncbi:hypothetical protein HPX47_004643 [Vibrio alginolyticus]|nr:hypothetical protein [Vibrio alginolyticus]